MTTHRPSPDHPWKRDRFKNVPARRSTLSVLPTTVRDFLNVNEIQRAVLEHTPLVASPISETDYGDRDMLVLSGSEGCRQKRALRYG